MTNTFLYIAWGVLYAVCAGLGFIVGAEGFAYGLLVFCCLLFFVPPSVLLYRAVKAKNQKTLRLIRNLSVIWLSVTLVLLVLNILTVAMSQQAGVILYYALIILTSPMICGQWWILALFCWACLLITSVQQLKKMKG